MQILISISLITLIVLVAASIKKAFINLNREINKGKILDEEISIAIRSNAKEIKDSGGLFRLKLASIKNLLLN